MGTEILTPVDSYVLFDIETTGLNSTNDRITEISALKIVNGKTVEEFSTLINPGVPIPSEITSLTGITNEMVKDAPKEKDAVKSFLNFAGDFILAGHNIKSFDLKFIKRVAEDLGVSINNNYVDSLTLARKLLPQLPSRSLGYLADYYGISYEGAHRAAADCKINQEVMQCLFVEPLLNDGETEYIM